MKSFVTLSLFAASALASRHFARAAAAEISCPATFDVSCAYLCQTANTAKRCALNTNGVGDTCTKCPGSDTTGATCPPTYDVSCAYICQIPGTPKRCSPTKGSLAGETCEKCAGTEVTGNTCPAAYDEGCAYLCQSPGTPKRCSPTNDGVSDTCEKCPGTPITGATCPATYTVNCAWICESAGTPRRCSPQDFTGNGADKCTACDKRGNTSILAPAGPTPAAASSSPAATASGSPTTQGGAGGSGGGSGGASVSADAAGSGQTSVLGDDAPFTTPGSKSVTSANSSPQSTGKGTSTGAPRPTDSNSAAEAVVVKGASIAVGLVVAMLAL